MAWELIEAMGWFGGERGVGGRERRPPAVNYFPPKEKHLLSPTCRTHRPRPGPPIGARFMA